MEPPPLVWVMSQHPDPTEIVLLLIQYGANPDIPSDIKGKEASALGIAAEGGNTKITETLLKNGDRSKCLSESVHTHRNARI